MRGAFHPECRGSYRSDREHGLIYGPVSTCEQDHPHTATCPLMGHLEASELYRYCAYCRGPLTWTRREAIAYLMRDGNLSVPGGRYGYDTRTCAPIAWRVAYLVARESGEQVDRERIDHAMGLVVNSSEDVAYMVNAYGYGHYGN